MYAIAPRRGRMGAYEPVSDWANQRVWTGTIQGSADWLRFSTVGLNSGLRVSDPQMAADIWAARNHCVRIEGPFVNGYIVVEGWAILPDATEFTQGGITYTCGDFKPKVGPPPEDPTPDVTSGGTVTTTAPIPPGVDPADVPADAPVVDDAGGASGGGYTGGGGAGGGGFGGALEAGALPLILGAGLLFALARPPKRRR